MRGLGCPRGSLLLPRAGGDLTLGLSHGHPSPEPDGGAASTAPGGSPNSRSRWGGGGRRASPFFGVETGAFMGTHPECTAEAPALVPSGSPGRSSPRHTQSCTHSHTCTCTRGAGAGDCGL